MGNRADAAARSAASEQLDLEHRDADVELSPLGRDQADAVGRWMADAPEEWRPTLVVSSPYRRAADTARAAIEHIRLPLAIDERLRERDLGTLDGLTGRGIRARYPEEAARRDKLGKFYYQPPSGESWADVVLRVRSLLADLRSGYGEARIWVFAHQAVIMSFRYVLESAGEQELLALDEAVTLANASVTTYERRGDGLELVSFADDSVVRDAGSSTTREPSVGDLGQVPR